jgi:hypothetical protein
VDGGFVKNGGPQNSPQRLEKSHIPEKFARMNMTLTGVFWLNPLLHKAYRRQVGVHPQKNYSILLFPIYLLWVSSYVSFYLW